MSTASKPFSVRSKIWIQDEKGHVVFGLGRYRMLDTIRRTGSLNAAAGELKMSYRAMWLRIRSSEQRMGKRLVERAGNGSQLTPFAKKLMIEFANLQKQIHESSDSHFDRIMSNSLNP